MSGHSKWAQIKHKKAATDAKKGREFSKLVREITIAAKTGGPNENANPRLRAAIDRAREASLPRENIERALERASGGGEDQKLEEFLYEATYPGGIMILIEGITDNKNRSLNEIKLTLAEAGAKLADPGSVMWNFSKIGILEISADGNPGHTQDEIESGIINAGAEDMNFFEHTWIVETKFEERESVRKKLEAGGIKVKSAGHDYKASSQAEPGPAVLEKAESVLNELSEQDDVQEVYTNLKEA